MSNPDTLDDRVLEVLAGEMGLQRVLEAHRADLVQAMQLVSKCRGALGDSLRPHAEPWPPMMPYTSQD